MGGWGGVRDRSYCTAICNHVLIEHSVRAVRIHFTGKLYISSMLETALGQGAMTTARGCPFSWNMH